MTIKAVLTISRGTYKGVSFELEQGANLVGRWDPDIAAFPEVDLEDYDVENKISRKHAIVRRLEGDTFTLEDLDSLNGTFVNRDRRLQSGEVVPIRSGDEIIIGKLFLTLTTSG